LTQALAKGVVVIALALAHNLFDDDDNNDKDDNSFVSLCRPCHRRQAATALVWGLVVVLARLLAQALVFVIVLALLQNLFDNYDDNDDDDDAFVSPCHPCHRRRAASVLVRGLVVALAQSSAQALARGIIVIILALDCAELI
jgi:hypothetical protein